MEALTAAFQVVLLTGFCVGGIAPATAAATGARFATLVGAGVAHIIAAISMGYLQLSGAFPGDVVGLYHPYGALWVWEGIVRGLISAGPTGTVTSIAAWWYSVMGVSPLGLYSLSGTVGFAAGCISVVAAARIIGTSPPGYLVGILLFLPTFLLWHGAFGKDPASALAIALLLFAVADQRVVNRVAGLAGIVLLVFIRPHFAAVAVAAFGATIMLAQKTPGRRVGAGVLLLVMAIVIKDVVVPSVFGLYLPTLDQITWILAEQNELLQIGGSASGIIATGGLTGYLKSVPYAAIALFTMPYPGQLSGILQLAVALETIAVLALMCYWVYILIAERVCLRYRPILFALCFSGIFVVAFAIPLTANFGLMVRQRSHLWFPLLFGLGTAVARHRYHRTLATE